MFNVCVVGYGNMGSAVAHALKRRGKCNVLVCDKSAPARDLARANGHDQVFSEVPRVSHRVDWWLVCVETPAPNGEPNYSVLFGCLQEIQQTNRGRVAVLSTLYPGYPSQLEELMHVYQPVFLRAGNIDDSANDWANPGKTVIGAIREEHAADYLSGVLDGPQEPVTVTSVSSAAWAKMLHNAFMCLKITFANQALAVGARWIHVITALAENERGRLMTLSHTRPGPPFDGPCLPKDSAVMATKSGFWKRVDYENKTRATWLWYEALGLGHGKVAVVGCSFRPGYDDMRGSWLLPFLAGAGPDIVRIWDPNMPRHKWDLLARRDPVVLSLKPLVTETREELDAWAGEVRACVLYNTDNTKRLITLPFVDVYL